MKKGFIIVLMVVAIATMAMAGFAFADPHRRSQDGGHKHWGPVIVTYSHDHGDHNYDRRSMEGYYPNGYYYGYGGPTELKIFGVSIISIGPKPPVVVVPSTPCPRNP